MHITHNGTAPDIHPDAWIAPDATVCGDVAIGAHSRVQHGARVIAEGGRIEVGEFVIVMENAVLRSTARHSLRIGSHCLVGPGAHVVGCTIEDEVFVATGSAVFHGSRLCRRSEVRVRGVVHIKSTLPPDSVVPIGWIAIGDPVRILPPERHDEIWAVQKPLNFPLEVYGYDRKAEAVMVKVTKRLSDVLGAHGEDEVI